ncbi:helix-turn-helix domain-containing protein [Nitratireductor mangrovi]|uniref:Helix-turn-helix domain-containing protein n=1 Tax=Nitratireductor mangrovi TaxID=2599600 RepID=A0A5B8KZN5_9HYPH|nr:helix-turn-helix domain-containing protein [Nitratireductor mangrovi]QDZ01046.1 helix-turn-helix domain-containing protein [Nitratireductor mangrovi]
MLSIGEMARRSGVKVPTIRYYEQMGLLEEPGRTEGNQRRYGAAELERLVFIRHARDLGIAIEAIRELIALSADPDRPCAEADRIAADHLGQVRDKIARLRRLEAELERIASCSAATVGECYVLRALGEHELCAGEH